MADLLNLARQQTLTTGPGTITLGPVVTGFISWAAAGAVDGAEYSYGIEEGNNREIGRGIYDATAGTLTRNVLKSTNNDQPIELTGTAQVVCLPAAEDFIDLIANHVSEPDPHPQYLTEDEGNAAYDPAGTASGAVAAHESADNPHPQYLTEAEGNAAYDPSGAASDAVAAHEATADPHTQYPLISEVGVGGLAVLSNDWDAITVTGVYRNSETTAVGIPTESTALIVHHMEYGNNAAVQIASRVSATQMWWRRKFGGAWQPWVAVHELGGSAVANHEAAADPHPQYVDTIQLEADADFYVDIASGSDETGDGSAGNPWQTANFAIDYIRANIDQKDYTVTIWLAAGNYGGVNVRGRLTGRLNIRGIVDNLSAVELGLYLDSTFNNVHLFDVTLVDAFGWTCVQIGDYSNLFLRTVRFAASSWSHIYMWGGYVGVVNGYEIFGGAAVHICVDNGEYSETGGGTTPKTITLTGTPAFSDAYAIAGDRGVINNSDIAYSGTATGKQYLQTSDYAILSGPLVYPGDLPGEGFRDGFYHKRNIVGTVSQSGGVPTGAIIEQGSNANGEYTKFADGTLICSAMVSHDITSATTQTYSYPVAFVSTPAIGFGLRSGGAGEIADWYNKYGVVIALNGSWASRTPGGHVATNTLINLALIAIGRWF